MLRFPSLLLHVAVLAPPLLLSGCNIGPNVFERMELENQAMKEQVRKEAADELSAKMDRIEQALAAGKSVVVVPLFEPNAALKKSGVGAPQYSRVVEWQKADDPKARFTVAQEPFLIRLNLNGRRQMIIVEPGAYRLASSSFDAPGKKAPDGTLKRGVRDLGVGKASFTDAQFDKETTVQEWRNAQYTTDEVKSQVCTQVLVVSGHCTFWATRTDKVQRQTAAAGYYDRPTVIKEAGLKVNLRPAKEFASFDVRPGEVLLADGFFAKTPNMNFYDNECERIGGSQIQCELSSFELQHIPAGHAAFMRDVPQIKDPRLAALLAKTQHRPARISARKGWADADWGQNYFQGSGR